jgi:8-oxo-dGTP pyrophosphatase MutT (NUDIX family)
MVKCVSIHGNTVNIPKEKLILRASAYGIIVFRNKVLLLNSKSTNKLWFPGGGAERGERLEDALRREVKEETGIRIKIKKFLYFEEVFFYYDPLNEAFHNLSFYYVCQPLSAKLTDKSIDLESNEPRWVDLNALKRSRLQPPADRVLGLYKNSKM